MQEEGYKKALEYDGEILEGTRIKVEPCKSAGRKANHKALANSGPRSKQHTGSAPKVSATGCAAQAFPTDVT